MVLEETNEMRQQILPITRRLNIPTESSIRTRSLIKRIDTGSSGSAGLPTERMGSNH
jgi:hypothetical protein